MAYADVRAWGPRLRYCSTSDRMENFQAQMREQLADFTLFGSGDFHHVTALLLRRVAKPFTLVSFDNHPDWDIRPPHWCCGTWFNRALELPQLRQAVVWGCANGELNWPGRLFARREPRLHAHPWAERTAPASQRIWQAVTRENWREKFSAFAAQLPVKSVYVTVDLDCLNLTEARTNWEAGLFTAAEVAWALRELRQHTEVVGGDVCGAWSAPSYERPFQKLAGWIDHPRPAAVAAAAAQAGNLRTLARIWPALIGGDERHARADK